jgi:hypothetical protein
MWKLRSGDPCTVDEDDCALSPNYPQSYSNDQSCKLHVLGATGTVPAIRVVSFETESYFDTLTVNGEIFSGTTGPEGLVVPSGSIDWLSDGSVTKQGWKLCPAEGPPSTLLPTPAPPTTAPWIKVSGPCTVDTDGCALSPNYPGKYGNNEECYILILNPAAFPIQVSDFDTEKDYDFLTVDGESYSGATFPGDVIPTGFISWASDSSVTRSGWKLCPSQR